jgi:hypothetical protein
MNYFTREDGIWYVNLENGTKVRAYNSGSMEVAYQMGLKANIHQQLAEFHANKADKHLLELHEINQNLKNKLDEQGKPSDSLEWI